MPVSWIAGPAARRGATWAQRVAARRPDLWPLPWPPHAGRAATIALRYVADLASEPELLAEAARACHASAARWWATACCAAQDSATAHAEGCRRVWSGGGWAALESRFSGCCPPAAQR